MIALSSFRPFDKCSHEIAQNQIRAFKSWLPAFDRIILFGQECPQLSSIKTEFVSSSGKPSIKELAQCAQSLDGWSAIINADIVVAKIPEVEWKLNRHQCVCAMSHRYDLKSGMMLDNGLDFFAAKPQVWSALAKKVPSEMCLGRCLWDTWTMTWMAHEYGSGFADVTGMRFIFHPAHGDRLDQNWNAPNEDFYLRNCKLPTTLLY